MLPYLVHALAHHPLCPNIDECVELEAFELIYWRLHLFLSVLLHEDDGQTGGGPKTPNKKEESFSAVVSIFHSIKCSEDVVDVKKSKTTHAICDLGLSIAKRIVQDQSSNLGMRTIQLPSILYKPWEKIENRNSTDNDEQTWLGSENTLAHFEALKNKSDKKTPKDELAVEESDGDLNEVPLGEMMKILAKKKRSVKKHNQSSNIKNIENNVGVLEVVRDIGLDNLEPDRSMKVVNLAIDTQHFGSGQMGIENSVDKDLVSQKRKRSDTTSSLGVPSPKRKRSDMQRSHSKSTKDRSEIPNVFWGQKSSKVKGMNGSADSDLLASCLPTIQSISSRYVKKDGEGSHVGEAASNVPKGPSILVESKKKNSNFRSLKGSIKKRRIRSMMGLAKCSTQKSDLSGVQLVGRRIKVWWPMDKQFYEGVVQSYDPRKKKHVILYDDGEVEVLLLNNEKWELVNKGQVPIKKPKPQHLSSDKELLQEKNKEKTQAGSRQYKNSLQKVRRKPARKVHIVDSKKDRYTDWSEAGSKSISDVSNAHPHSYSEVDDASSDELEEKGEASLANKPEEGLVTEEKSNASEEISSPSSPDGGRGMADSDDEPLSVWRARARRAK